MTRAASRLAPVVLGLSLVACASRPIAHSPPARVPKQAPVRSSAVTSIDRVSGRPFFGPDGRVYVPFRDHVLVAAPDDLEHGEVLPYRGELFPRAGRLFGLTTQGDPSDPSASRLAELDYRLQETKHLDIPEGYSSIAFAPSGAFVTVVTYTRRRGPPVATMQGLYRTSDFSRVATGVEATRHIPGRAGELQTSGEERYVVSGNQVLDTQHGKEVFSHRSLGASTLVFEGERLHWLFRDLLETVELGSGRRSVTWLPCDGPSAADPRGRALYTACASGLERTTFASGVPSVTHLPYPHPVDVRGLRVDESGKVVVLALGPEAREGGDSVVPAFALAPGGAAVGAVESVVVAAPRPYLEGGSVTQSCRVFLGDGRPVPMRPVSCDASLSPSGRFVVSPVYGGVEVFALPEGKLVGKVGASMGSAFNGTFEVEDGELLGTRSGGDREAKVRIRLGPSEAAGSDLRVRMVPVSREKPVNVLVDHDTVVLETATGKPVAQFPFAPYYTGRARLVGGEIVVHTEGIGGRFGQPHRCKRSGECQPILPGVPVLAFGGVEAFGATKVSGASVFVRVDLRTGAEVTIATPKDVTSAAAVSDGWVLGLSDGTLAHVSRATGAVDRVSDAGLAKGLPIVGAVGDRVVLAQFGPDVVIVDTKTFTVSERYLVANDGYLHVDAEGRYATTGEATDLEAFVLCTDGHRAFPRASCRRTSAK